MIFDRDALHRAQRWQESRNDPNAVSPVGAIGLMQIMPATARQPGFGMKPLTNIRDPKANEAFGRSYMDKMLSRYSGNVPEALAAYNWGAGNADKWNGDLSKLPAETRTYIKNITSKAGIGSTSPEPSSNPQVSEPMQNPAYNPMDVKPYQDIQRRKGLFGIPADQWLALAAGFGGSDSIGEGASRYAQLQMQNNARYGDKNDAARKEHEQRQQLAQYAGGIDLSQQERQLLSILPPQQQMAFLQKKLSQNEPSLPNSVQEYQFAQSQGFGGSYEEWQLQKGKAGASNVSVNNNMPGSTAVPEYNKLPAGYVYKRGADGQVLIDESGVPTAVPIQGGPASIEAQETAVANQNKREGVARSANVVLQDIDRALEQIDGGLLPTTGFVGDKLSGLGGTQAHDLSKTISTIRGNVGFDRLQQMREASKTGGALGAINKTEMDLLQSVLGNLEQSQSEEQLRYNLQRVKTIYSSIFEKAQAYPNADQFGFGAGRGQSTPKRMKYNPATGRLE